MISSIVEGKSEISPLTKNLIYFEKYFFASFNELIGENPEIFALGANNGKSKFLKVLYK